jgi:hypothetical protein
MLSSMNHNLSEQETDCNNLDNWKSIFYGSRGDGAIHPDTIVRADNNWQLLLEMKNGLTLSQLDILKVPYTPKQLVFLQSQKLLYRSQDVYKTAFPILSITQTSNLREKSLVVANHIYADIEKKVSDLVEFLTKQNLSNNAFSILFSYVIDGLIWKRFEQEGMVKERVSAGIWDGVYWFMKPIRSFSCGTSSIVSDEVILSINTDDETTTHGLFHTNFEAILPLAFGDVVPTNEVIREYAPFGFFDK